MRAQRLSALVAAPVVVLLLSVLMPHIRSAGAAAARRERAARLGFLQPVSSGHRHVLVRTQIADRAKSVVKSLSLHAEHVRLTGLPHHFAKQAAIDAELVIGHEARACGGHEGSPSS